MNFKSYKSLWEPAMIILVGAFSFYGIYNKILKSLKIDYSSFTLVRTSNITFLDIINFFIRTQIRNNLFIFGFILMLTIILLPIMLFLFRKKITNFPRFSLAEFNRTRIEPENKTRRRQLVIYCFIALSIVILLHKYYRLSALWPPGGDTQFYIYKLARIKQYGLLDELQYSDRPLFIFFTYIFKWVFCLDEQTVFRILPIVLLIPLSLAWVLFSSSISSYFSKPFSMMCLIIFGLLSTFSLRNLLDLHAQTFAMTPLLISFYFIIKYYNTDNKRFGVYASVFITMTFFSHIFSAIVGAFIILVFTLMTLLIEKGQRKKIIQRLTLVSFIPSVMFFSLVLLQIFEPTRYGIIKIMGNWIRSPFIQLLYGQTIKENLILNPFEKYELSLKLLWGNLGESFGTAIPTLLAIFALPYLSNLRNSGTRFLYSMCISSLLLSFLGARWRFITFFPLPILATIGLMKTTELVSRRSVLILGHNLIGLIKLKRLIYLVIMVLIISSSTNYLMLARDWPPSPKVQTLKEIYEIKQLYGYANRSLIIVSRVSDSQYWIAGEISPGVLLYGDLLPFILYKVPPLNTIQKVNRYIGALQRIERLKQKVQLNLTEVIVTESTYKPTFEKKFLNEIAPGIYKVKNLSKTDYNDLYNLYNIIYNKKAVNIYPFEMTLNNTISFNDAKFLGNNLGEVNSFLLVNKSPLNQSILTFKNKEIKYGYNLRFVHTFTQEMNFLEASHIGILLKANFMPGNARVYLWDEKGNHTRYEFIYNNAGSIDWNVIEGNLGSKEWVDIRIPMMFFLKDDVDLSKVKRFELRLTPIDELPKEVDIGGIYMSRNLDKIVYARPDKFPDLINYEYPPKTILYLFALLSFLPIFMFMIQSCAYALQLLRIQRDIDGAAVH